MVNRLQSLNLLSEQPRRLAEAPVQGNGSKREALRCALQGWKDAWSSQPNLRFHVYAAAAVIAVSAVGADKKILDGVRRLFKSSKVD